jgi:histone H3/H4
MADHYNQLVGGSSGGHGGSPERGGGSEGIKEQDRLLPIANVGRIMKQILPPNAKVSKEAKETMQECVSEFISFVTGEASDKCHKEKRKTVNGDDVCWAFSALGFDDYVDPMRRYLLKFRELEGDRAAAAASSRGGGMPIYNAIADLRPDFFLHSGDLHVSPILHLVIKDHEVSFLPNLTPT